MVDHPDPKGAHVHDTWARSYLAKALQGARNDMAHLARDGHRHLRDGLLTRCRVRAVVDAEHPEYIHGYAVWEILGADLVIHWVYVRSASRRDGVGYALLRDALSCASDATRVIYTHRTWFAPWCESHGIVYGGLR